jgi:hypothetical protein
MASGCAPKANDGAPHSATEAWLRILWTSIVEDRKSMALSATARPAVWSMVEVQRDDKMADADGGRRLHRFFMANMTGLFLGGASGAYTMNCPQELIQRAACAQSRGWTDGGALSARPSSRRTTQSSFIIWLSVPHIRYVH